MKLLTVDLQKEFPVLKGKATLTCYLNDNHRDFAKDRQEPAVLICPGGAYCFVSFCREGEAIALDYMTRGYHAFVLTYSVAPFTYPQQLLEAAAAMRYIRAHGKEWQVDPDKIAICGFSAGGHLAASLGVFWDRSLLQETLGFTAEVFRPNAMILGYPVISSREDVLHRGSFEALTGQKDAEASLWKEMALEKQVTRHTPPAYVWHTAADGSVPVMNSLLFCEALAEQQVPFELHVFPAGYHGLATCDRATNGNETEPWARDAVWMQESFRWLNALWGN